MGINFPATPTIGQKYPQPAIAGIPVYTWDGEKWTTVGGSIAAYAPPADAVPLMDATPGLVGTTTEYAREDHVHPTDTSRMPITAFASSLAYSGMQINGGMEVSQELGTGGRSTPGYVCDGWAVDASVGFSGWQQGSYLVPGLPAFLMVNNAAAKPSLAAGDYLVTYQSIEGVRISRLSWGTASAQPITIAFWSSHDITGLYSVVVTNSPTTRSYCATYTQVASNVPQYNVITIPGATAGTWVDYNNIGMVINFVMAAGTTWTAPAANAWQAGYFLAAPGQVNGIAVGNSLRITGVTVLPGTQAPTAAQSPNIMRPYGEEWVTCQRYWQIAVPGLQTYSNSGTFYSVDHNFPQRMRATPTITYAGTVQNNGFNAPIIESPASDRFRCTAQAGSTAQAGFAFLFLCDARL